MPRNFKSKNGRCSWVKRSETLEKATLNILQNGYLRYSNFGIEIQIPNLYFVFILYRQQVYKDPITDGVETIKPINRHGIHPEHIRAKSLGYGNYHTELINIVTHF